MVDEQETTRRERRVIARKAQILEAAVEIFREKGYGRATTREIAEAADVSEGTLYNYFKNKRDLLIGLVQEFAAETIEDIGTIEAAGIDDLVLQILTRRLQAGRNKRLITLFLHEARMDPEIHRYYVEEMMGRFIGELEDRLELLISAGVLRPLNPAVTARVIISSLMGLSVLFDVGDDPVLTQMSDEELAQEMFIFFKHGFYPCPENDSGGEQ